VRVRIVELRSYLPSDMTTILDSVLKREITIGGEPYTLTLSPEGFSLVVKGRRNGLDIAWADLVAGDAALATALNASLTANLEPRSAPAQKKSGESRSKTAKAEDPRAVAARLFEVREPEKSLAAPRSNAAATPRERSPGTLRKGAAAKSRPKPGAKRVEPRKPAAKLKRK